MLLYIYIYMLLIWSEMLQFPWKEISVLPVQWHALCFGLFASIIAPFGGFFASGFKRAFNIKVYLHHEIVAQCCIQ